MKKPVTPKHKEAAGVPAAGANRPLQIAFTDKDIRQRVRELARQIDRDCAGKTLQVVGVLEDGFVFMADLVRNLSIPLACGFVHTDMRDNDSGLVAMREITYVPPVNLTGKNLLLVEGVVVTGITLDYLRQALLAQQPASLRTVTLLDRAGDRKVDVPVDYSAFQISGPYLFGYGLGYEELHRNLPYLASLVE